jgi:hypothetical protein
MMAASIIFGLSLIGIIGLFVLKSIEIRRDRRFLPGIRSRADDQALRLKDALLDSRHQAAKLAPFSVFIARLVLREIALGLARFGRMLEREAHRLADMASSKHKFERKETKSEFLRSVTEHKNGNGVDATE